MGKRKTVNAASWEKDVDWSIRNFRREPLPATPEESVVLTLRSSLALVGPITPAGGLQSGGSP